jgi:hypothetical protein
MGFFYVFWRLHGFETHVFKCKLSEALYNFGPDTREHVASSSHSFDAILGFESIHAQSYYNVHAASLVIQEKALISRSHEFNSKSQD